MFYTLTELSIGIKAGTLILVSLPLCDPSPHIEMDRSQSLNASLVDYLPLGGRR